MRYLYVIIIAMVITIGTLFIPQKVEVIDKPYVNLGYPIKYVSIVFINNFPDAPNERQKNRRFNILSSWENHVDTSWVNFTISYALTIFTLEVFYVLTKKFKFKK